MAELPGWDNKENGQPVLNYLMSYQTAVVKQGGLVRLVYANDKEEFERGGSNFQLALTTEQLRELGRELMMMADTIERHPAATRQ